ncbi:MAG: glycosyltransferase family 2 protein [Solirubrobacteraceae bacterium]
MRSAKEAEEIDGVPAPLVSVVVSTYNRPARLALLLAGLRSQRLPGESFEVVVVDNGSVGYETQAVLRRELERGELVLETLRHARTLGPAGGRNSGWRLARATLIAFTDDDCVPDPGWLMDGLREHRARPGAVIQGRTRPDRGEIEQDGLLSHTQRIERLGPWYETCNIFYPRTVLDSLGGFDERFGSLPAGEDTDLAWRAIEAGCPMAFAPNAVVRHAVEHVGALGMLRIAARWTAAVRLFAEHPELRAVLYRGAFWNNWHYLLWRSLLALLAPRWLRRNLITLHLFNLRKRTHGAGAGAWMIPFLLLHDLVECWAVARGAVRYRTLVL